MKPYIDILSLPFIKIRFFSKKVVSEDLIWHSDNTNRILIPLVKQGWYFQFDNELPIEMPSLLYIKKGSIHRILKSMKSPLFVVILEW